MSYISQTIEREVAKMTILRDTYEKELELLPKGSIQVRERNEKRYFYLRYRDGKRTVTAYLGNTEEHLAKALEDIEKRKHIESMIKALDKELRMMNKVLEGMK